jgi:hypothetical protein
MLANALLASNIRASYAAIEQSYQAPFLVPEGSVSGTDITIKRAILHCLPIAGHFLYITENIDIQNHLESMASCAGFLGRVYGNDVLRVDSLKRKEVLLSKLFCVQTLITLAALSSLVALGILTLPTQCGTGFLGVVKCVSIVNFFVFISKPTPRVAIINSYGLSV